MIHVNHPRFPSYIISNAKITLNELHLTCFIPQDLPITAFFKQETLDRIQIQILNSQGDIIDTVSCNICRVKNVITERGWHLDRPQEIVITYEFEGMDNNP